MSSALENQKEMIIEIRERMDMMKGMRISIIDALREGNLSNEEKKELEDVLTLYDKTISESEEFLGKVNI